MVFFMVFIGCSKADNIDTMKGKLILAWYQGACALEQSVNGYSISRTRGLNFCSSAESEMLQRVHMQMEYSYDHDTASVSFVIQNMAFVREAE